MANLHKSPGTIRRLDTISDTQTPDAKQAPRRQTRMSFRLQHVGGGELDATQNLCNRFVPECERFDAVQLWDTLHAVRDVGRKTVVAGRHGL